MLQKLTHKKQLGHDGEQAVVDYLIKQGYTICARNYTITRGEVDIIAQKEQVIAFVEVKTRNTLYFNLSEVIVPAKQRKIIFAARHYIFKQGLREHDIVYRFDVALLAQKTQSLASGAASWDITYIRDAFTDTETLV